MEKLLHLHEMLDTSTDPLSLKAIDVRCRYRTGQIRILRERFKALDSMRVKVLWTRCGSLYHLKETANSEHP
jgi:hypothetical protein